MGDNAEIANLISPSLAARVDGVTAFEVKFQIDHSLAAEVSSWAKEYMTLDQYCEKEASGRYQITSLYTDTESRDVYFRTPKYRRRKYRLRRYGHEDVIHLERKVRRGDEVAKKRTTITSSELRNFQEQDPFDAWEGQWFLESLTRKHLFPTCVIRYDRRAFFSSSSEGPLRLTMDSQICGGLSSAWKVELPNSVRQLADGKVVLELKFQNAMPVPFKRLVCELQLEAAGFSKYRHCMTAFSASENDGQRELKYA